MDAGGLRCGGGRGARRRCRRHKLEKLTDEQFALMAAANQPRSKTFVDAAGFCSFLLLETEAIEYDEKAVKKFIAKNDGEGLNVLGELRGVLRG